MNDYDYNEYEETLKIFLHTMWRDPDCLEIGENISDTPEIKIIFESYGCNEETNEQDDKNMECYAIFIHKDSAQEGFEFPEHETTPWCLIHRPDEEVCIFAWYDVENDDWCINSLEETSEHKMTNQEVVQILKTLRERYCGESESLDSGVDENGNASWPFSGKNNDNF
jgi:hypothetical protein